MVRPSASTWMRSQRRMIRRRSWSTSSTPQPALVAHGADRCASRSSDSVSFMPAAGSSSSRKRGSPARARAISTRRCSAVGERRGAALGDAARPIGSSSSSTPSGLRPRATAPTTTFSRTVMSPNRRICWNVRPMPSRANECGLAAGRGPLADADAPGGRAAARRWRRSAASSCRCRSGRSARRSRPRSTVRLTPSSARTPRNCLTTASATSACPCAAEGAVAAKVVRARARRRSG